MPILRFFKLRVHALVLTLVFGICLLVTSPLHAQQTFQFSNFSVEGNQRIEAASILSFAGLPAGQTVSAGQVNDAQQRVVDSGFFESVQFVPRGSTLVIQVQERPTISRINVEGNVRIDDEEILELITSQPRQVYLADRAEEDARAIIDAYEARARFNASVNPVIIRRPDNRVDLVFEVVEGNVVEIERISFVGNTKYSDGRLRRALASKQAGFFRQLVQSDTFIADRIAFDSQLLTDFYNARGYIDFAVLGVSPEFSRERNATFITFTVREGQKFDLGEITVTSALPEVDAAVYGEVVKIRSGQTYSPLAIQSTIDRIEKTATDNQLDFVSVNPVLSRNDRDLTVDVEFQIVRAPRVFVERIDIEGNATTVDRVIRQQFTTVEGDPFNPREIQRSADRIRALGLFEVAEVETRPGSSTDQVVVDVDVVEQPTGSLSFGASYSVENGIGFLIGYSERNFLGRGQTFSFDLEAGTQSSQADLTFIEPYFLGRDLRFRFQAFYEETEFDNVDYNTRRIGLASSLTFPVNDFSRLRVGYVISQDDIFDVEPTASPILLAEEGSRLTSAINYNFSYDTRVNGLDPTLGVLLSFGQQFAGLGGDNKYIRTDARALVQKDVFNEEITLRASAVGGALVFFDGDSRVIDRYNSSSNQLRGFASRGIGPRDLNTIGNDTLGGNYYTVFSVEAEFPLGLPEEYGISAGVFYNIGSVWGLDNTNGAGGPNSVDDSLEWRSAVGFSIFWSTPFGPLRMDFSQPLEKNDFDETQSFNLSVQTTF